MKKRRGGRLAYRRIPQSSALRSLHRCKTEASLGTSSATHHKHLSKNKQKKAKHTKFSSNSNVTLLHNLI